MKKATICTLAIIAMTQFFAPTGALARTGSQIEPKIIGGDPVPFPLYSYQVGLLINNQFCGGVLINQQTILTAAHCLDSVSNPNQIMAIIGTGDLNVGLGQEQHQFQVNEFRKHENYRAGTFENDLAVLRLDYHGLSLGKKRLLHRQKKATISRLSPQPGTTAFVSGWGRTDQSTGITSRLQAAVVRTVSHQKCTAKKPYDELVQKDSMLCAGSPLGGRDACQGDSGGPLVRRLGGQNFLVGIVSFGLGCGLPDFPGVYADVAKLRPWILQNLFR